MNGIDFIVAQHGIKPLPEPPRMTPPGGGKLSVSQTAEIIERHTGGESLSALGRKFGVTYQAIDYIVRKAKRDASK